MSPHKVSEPQDEVPSSALCSLHVDIRFNIGIPMPRLRSARSRRRSAPPPYSKSHEAQIPDELGSEVRRGSVHVEECGAQISSWYFKINWLVLTESHLALHGSANQAPRAIISMSDIVKLERTDTKLYGLILETRQGKNYSLTFKNDDDLYGWQDAICYRFKGVSNPRDFKHNVHVSVDPSSRDYYTGLPKEWRKLLSYPQGELHPTFTRPPQTAHVPVGLPQTLLRITLNKPLQLETLEDPSHVATMFLSTTLQVTPVTRLNDILDRVCRKTNLEPTGCALSLAGDDNRTPLSLDATVADLKGEDNLVLVTL